MRWWKQRLTNYVINLSEEMQTRMDESEIRISKLEDFFSGQSNNFVKTTENDGLMPMADREKIAMIGGLTMTSMEDARQWIPQQIWENCGPKPIEIYCKGDYRNIAYVSFKNKDDKGRYIKKQKKSNWAE